MSRTWAAIAFSYHPNPASRDMGRLWVHTPSAHHTDYDEEHLSLYATNEQHRNILICPFAISYLNVAMQMATEKSDPVMTPVFSMI